MKILLINNFFYKKGGAEAVFFNTAELLLDAGHEVVFFSYKDRQNLPCKQEPFFIERGGKVHQIINYFYNKDAARNLEALVEVEKPDIAHIHLIWGGISPSIFKVLKKHHIPIIHTAHDYRMICPAYTFRNMQGVVCEECKGGHFLHCLRNRCSKGSLLQSALMTAEMYYRNKRWNPATELDGVIYVSDFSRRKHEEFDPRFSNLNSITLYNFTRVGEQFPSVEYYNGGYFIYYGRLSYEKGVATLIKAFSKFPSLPLKVVGTGPEENILKSIAGRDVEFIGYKTGSELFDLVRSSKFVCVPSEWYENNPMTIVEAYSLGIPVIGANIGGIPEIVERGKTGFLFDSGDVDSLAEAVNEALSLNEEEYHSMKENAREFAKSHFDSTSYLTTLVNFYQETKKFYRKD